MKLGSAPFQPRVRRIYPALHRKHPPDEKTARSLRKNTRPTTKKCPPDRENARPLKKMPAQSHLMCPPSASTNSRHRFLMLPIALWGAGPPPASTAVPRHLRRLSHGRTLLARICTGPTPVSFALLTVREGPEQDWKYQKTSTFSMILMQFSNHERSPVR